VYEDILLNNIYYILACNLYCNCKLLQINKEYVREKKKKLINIFKLLEENIVIAFIVKLVTRAVGLIIYSFTYEVL
jgi:hypothetical protein